MEYTKREWKAIWVNIEYPNQELRIQADDGLIATMNIYRNTRNHGLSNTLPQEANAHLIAAAPDMLETLKHLMGRIDEGLALGEALDLTPARKAIAKAEGK